MAVSIEITDFGIDPLPTDGALYPAEVVAKAGEVDALLIQWDELVGRASAAAQEAALRAAERADAEALTAKLLAGETEGLDDTPNADAARAANAAASTKAAALRDALNVRYAELRELLIANAAAIRQSLTAEFATAADELEQMITEAQEEFAARAERFALVAAAPGFVAALIAGASSGLSMPYVAVPSPDFSGAEKKLAEARKLAAVAMGADTPRPYLGTFVGSNGMAWPADLLRQFPPYDAAGKFDGVVTLSDGTTVETVQEAAAIRVEWQKFGYSLPAR